MRGEESVGVGSNGIVLMRDLVCGDQVPILFREIAACLVCKAGVMSEITWMEAYIVLTPGRV